MSRTFDEMGTLGSPSPTRRPTMKSRLRRLERCCCRTFTYFPLAFVYGLTTWAVWVELHTSFLGAGGIGSYIKAALGAGLWALANASYIFCWACFAVTSTWVWAEIMDEVKMEEGLMVVNVILLAVLAGVIGLVLTGFTAWHFYLAITGQTTIESLEKTRYLSPLRKTLEPEYPGRHTLGGGDSQNAHRPLTDHLKEIHANALPGVLRPEEGETSSGTTSRSLTPNPYPPHHQSSSPAQTSLHNTFATLEAQREHDRYNAYLDELDSEKLPNAFDNGWRRNLSHIFGPEPLLWGLPVCNTSGDGWSWEISGRWEEARGEVAREREARRREEEVWGETGSGVFGGTLEQQRRLQMDGRGGEGGRPAGRGFEGPAAMKPRKDFKWVPGRGFVDVAPPVPSLAPPQQQQQQQQQQQFPRSAGAPPPPRRPKGGSFTPSSGDRSGSAEPSTSDLQMQPLDRRPPGTRPHGLEHSSPSDSDSDSDSDEDEEDRAMKKLYNNNSIYGYPQGGEEEGAGNWNDVPEEYLRRGEKAKGKDGGKKGRRGRWKGE
ncbi:hypothetical protein D0862_13397 [Hortaea werneckii]|uniref:Palmitoyltransferase n=1 Tax=Hortaea werneckii TaxID=91943 RepID=A0A3M7EQG4_HORWE|nr:hypothetical protein D0862_13397 [Hortaea werneckii]